MVLLNSRSTRCAFVAAVQLLLVGCSIINSGLPTPTVSPFITKHQAIDIALRISRTPRIEELATPTNLLADLTSYGKAIERVSDSYIQPGYSPDSMVWLITMDGVWTAGSPGYPPPEPRPIAHHLTIIIDAKTGLELGSSLTR